VENGESEFNLSSSFLDVPLPERATLSYQTLSPRKIDYKGDPIAGEIEYVVVYETGQYSMYRCNFSHVQTLDLSNKRMILIRSESDTALLQNVLGAKVCQCLYVEPGGDMLYTINIGQPWKGAIIVNSQVRTPLRREHEIMGALREPLDFAVLMRIIRPHTNDTYAYMHDFHHKIAFASYVLSSNVPMILDTESVISKVDHTDDYTIDAEYCTYTRKGPDVTKSLKEDFRSFESDILRPLVVVKGASKEMILLPEVGPLTYAHGYWSGIFDVNFLIKDMWEKEKGLHHSARGVRQIMEKLRQVDCTALPMPHVDFGGVRVTWIKGDVEGCKGQSNVRFSVARVFFDALPIVTKRVKEGKKPSYTFIDSFGLSDHYLRAQLEEKVSKTWQRGVQYKLRDLHAYLMSSVMWANYLIYSLPDITLPLYGDEQYVQWGIKIPYHVESDRAVWVGHLCDPSTLELDDDANFYMPPTLAKTEMNGKKIYFGETVIDTGDLGKLWSRHLEERARSNTSKDLSHYDDAHRSGHDFPKEIKYHKWQ